MHKNRLLLFICMFALAIIFNSCNKDPDRIGLDLQPEGDNLVVLVSDTTSIYAYSVFVDSIRTDETAISLLGSYYDPVFGSSTASIYTQVRLTTSSIDFGENPVLDSIILAFEYTGEYYGDTTYAQNLKVFRMDETIYGDSSYYSNQNMAITEELASFNFQPSPTDSIFVDTLKYKAQLRIPLTEEFGQSLLDAPVADLSSGDSFLEFLKGVYVTTEMMQMGGAILYFNLVSENSKMSIYYSNDEDDSLSYTFAISSGNARFMNFEHYNYENAGPEFRAQVIDGDTTLGDDKLYLQSMAGARVKFKFPHIKDWVKNNSIAINEARLTINNYNPDSDFAAPPELVVLKTNDDGTSGFIPDQFEGLDYFGGEYDDESGEYFFRLSRYVQYLLTEGAEDYGLELVVSGGSLMANRALVVGPYPDPINDISKRIRLKLIYTNLNN